MTRKDILVEVGKSVLVAVACIVVAFAVGGLVATLPGDVKWTIRTALHPMGVLILALFLLCLRYPKLFPWLHRRLRKSLHLD